MYDWGIPETAEVHPTNNHHKPMKVSIEFNTDNAAFDDDCSFDENGIAEIKRILGIVSTVIEPEMNGDILDVNGNTIGTWSWS